MGVRFVGVGGDDVVEEVEVRVGVEEDGVENVWEDGVWRCGGVNCGMGVCWKGWSGMGGMV